MMSDRKICKDCPLRNSRSVQQNRLFFDFLKHTYSHWPLSSKFKPNNVEHLRAYLLVKAGHSITSKVDLPGQIYPEHIKVVVYGLIQAIDKHCFIKIAPTGEYFEIAYPKSMSFDKLGEKKFTELMEHVFDIVENDYIVGARREFILT